MVAIDQTEVSKRLAAWAGIFAVATVLAGLWGMNFSHMPELEWEYGYPLALGAIAASCGLLYWQFRRARWL
jgi:magnesium transporter